MKENNILKVTHIVYRLLDFLPESDPLKHKSKEKVLAILEHATQMNQAEGWFSLGKEKIAEQLLQDIEILENYLSLGKLQGWVDDMNFLIISKEYQRIKESLKLLNLQKPEPKPKPTLKEKSIRPVIQSYSPRQEKILKVLDQKDKVQVSDLIKELPNITKRTVRRDLDDLLKKGKIVRLGEWNQVFYQKIDRTDNNVLSVQ